MTRWANWWKPSCWTVFHVRASGAAVHEVRARGWSALARLLTLTLQGDLVATYLGIARGEDPSPIEAIAGLKRALAES